MDAADPYEFERPSWHGRAACRGTEPDLFFPERGEETLVAAVLYCSRCPVADQCAEHGIRRESEGIWGGLSQRQRRRIRHERRITLEVIDPLAHLTTPDPEPSEGETAA